MYYTHAVWETLILFILRSTVFTYILFNSQEECCIFLDRRKIEKKRKETKYVKLYNIPKQRVSNLGRNSVILTPSWPTFRLHFAKLEILLVFISFKKLTLKTICKLNTSKETKASFSNNFIDIAKVTLTQAY